MFAQVVSVSGELPLYFVEALRTKALNPRQFDTAELLAKVCHGKPVEWPQNMKRSRADFQPVYQWSQGIKWSHALNDKPWKLGVAL